MSKHEKALARVLQGTPDTDVTFDELRGVLLRLGFEERAPSGSHYTYSHPDIRDILTVPRHRPTKPVYVRKARALILKHNLASDDGSG